MKKKINLMTIISSILILVALILLLFWPDTKTTIIVCSIIILLSIFGIIFGFIAKTQIKKNQEKGKIISIISIILGFIICFLSALSIVMLIAIKDVGFNDSVICPKITNCVDNGDGTSSCEFQENYQITCSTKNLTPQQFK